MATITVTPAYGRDYTSAQAARVDWDAGRDFIISDMFHPADGKPVNREDGAGNRWVIRYDRLRKIAPLNY